MAILEIDVGTTNSLVGVYRSGCRAPGSGGPDPRRASIAADGFQNRGILRQCGGQIPNGAGQVSCPVGHKGYHSFSRPVIPL